MRFELPKILIIMYHSVSGENSPQIIGSFPITFKKFQRQLAQLKNLGYQFGHADQLEDAINSSDRVAFITSDDGTVDWCSNALPFLEAEGIPSHLGLISGVLEKEPIFPLTHIAQVILKTRKNNQLKRLAEDLIKITPKDDIQHFEQHYCYETDNIRRAIKGCLNLSLPTSVGLEAVSPLSTEEVQHLKNRFASLEKLQNFRYLSVGNHTRTHQTLGTNAQSYFEEEVSGWCLPYQASHIRISKAFTLPITGKAGAAFGDLAVLLQKAGYTSMFTGEGLWNGTDFLIPRIDAKNLERWIEQ